MKSYLLKIFTSCAALFLIAACTEEMELVSSSFANSEVKGAKTKVF